jgi:LacI family transcriptional regulator
LEEIVIADFLFTKPVSHTHLISMGITIKKIADDLKLAVSTVSKALGDSHEISAETKKRVLDYARKLDYVPNTYASSLKKRKTGNIAVVVPEVADSYFATAINGIEAVAQVKGYHVIIYITHEDQTKEQSIVREFRSGRVDGVLMSVSSGKNVSTHLQELVEKVPLVFFDRACEDVAAAKVLTNDFDSGYKVTEHLIKRGCQKIAFLAQAENLSMIKERLNGYLKALSDHEIKLKKEFVISCSGSEPTNHALIKKLLSRKDRPDAIVGSTEKLTTMSYSVCHELGINIPSHLKVAGFSSMGIAALLNPPLTTITQPAFEMGRAAATILFKKLEGKKISPEIERVVIPSMLVERRSSE